MIVVPTNPKLERAFAYFMATNPKFKEAVKEITHKLTLLASDRADEVDEFITACYIMDLGEPEHEVFV